MEKYTLKDFGRDVVPVYGAIKNVLEDMRETEVSIKRIVITTSTVVYNAILFGVSSRLIFGDLEEIIKKLG